MPDSDEWKLEKPAPTGGDEWKKESDPTFMTRHPQFAQDVSDLGKVVKGAGRAGAGAISTVMNVGEEIGKGESPLPDWMTGGYKPSDIPGVGPYIGPAAKIFFPPSQIAAASEASPTLQNLRKQVQEFGEAPTESAPETFGKYGAYAAMAPEAAWRWAGKAALGAGVAGLGILKTATKWQIADIIAEKAGLPPWVVYHFLEFGGGRGR